MNRFSIANCVKKIKDADKIETTNFYHSLSPEKYKALEPRFSAVNKSVEQLIKENNFKEDKQPEQKKDFKTVKSKDIYSAGDNSIRVQITTIDGEPFVSICKFYRPPGGYFYPTRKQITLPLEAWCGLVGSVGSINKSLKKRGFGNEFGFGSRGIGERGTECNEELGTNSGGPEFRGMPCSSRKRVIVVHSPDSPSDSSGEENSKKARPQRKGDQPQTTCSSSTSISTSTAPEEPEPKRMHEEAKHTELGGTERAGKKNEN